MTLTLSLVLLIVAAILFAIGAVRPGILGVDWVAAGLAFAAASLVVA